MKYYFLASGSKGNCFVLFDQNEILIIDAGTTKKYLTDAFSKVDIDYKQAVGVLVTHTHTDHVSQIKMFKDLPVYSSTLIKDIPLTVLQPYEPFYCGHYKITAVALSHDCENTVGYIIETQTEKLVYITDTGYVKENVQQMAYNPDYLILESNHDPVMLMKTNRPYMLKMRILSDSGHLSNEVCGQLCNRLMGPRTKEIVLAHISEEANTVDCALETVSAICKENPLFANIELKAALQHQIIIGGSE